MRPINDIDVFELINLVREIVWKRNVKLTRTSQQQALQLINLFPNDAKMELINNSRCTIDYIKQPTDKMTRLHEMKWKL